MTEQQKTAIQEAAIAHEIDTIGEHIPGCDEDKVERELCRDDFSAGATEVINNPLKYGLIEISLVEETNIELEAENQRYKEALERIYNDESMSAMVSWRIAQQALKGESK